MSDAAANWCRQGCVKCEDGALNIPTLVLTLHVHKGSNVFSCDLVQ